MRETTINVSEITEYLKMSKIESETKQALNNYNRIRFLLKKARDNLKEKREEYDNQKKLCPSYKFDSTLSEELSKVRTWTPQKEEKGD